jgi:hypothetical protein
MSFSALCIKKRSISQTLLAAKMEHLPRYVLKWALVKLSGTGKILLTSTRKILLIKIYLILSSHT